MKKWLEIASDQSTLTTYRIREQVIDAIRHFFKQEGFLEVETPLLVKNPGTEPYLEVFKTTLKTKNHKDTSAFLVTSPELLMKKLLAAGVGSCFQIGKSFRNDEGVSSFHNHEFTLLEWYRIDADYTDIMRDCELLLRHILQAVSGSTSETMLSYQGKKYDIASRWERISVAEAFKKYADISTETLLDTEALLTAASKKGFAVDTSSTWEEAYNQIFLNEIEPNLGLEAPTILYDYPLSQAALSMPKASDPRFAERFEIYLAGIELGNAFSELTDAKEQRKRMQEDLQLRTKLGKYTYDLDEDFLQALEMGMPRTGGIAVGVDRLVMLFADVPTLRDTLFFPISDVFELT